MRILGLGVVGTLVAPSKFDMTAGGQSHSLARKSNGEVWSWGQNNTYGNLGDNTVIDKSSPISVVGNHSFILISCAPWINYHPLALKSDGSVWAWGEGTGGGLGNNATTSRSSPVSVVGAHSFISIAAGRLHSVGLKSNGEVWTWGQNELYGQLGVGNIVNRSSPVSVVGAHSFISIAAGSNFSLALKSNGRVWAWGEGISGQLGNNLVNKSSTVAVVGAHSFILIVAGTSHGVGLKSNGEVWSWGSNSYGQLGDNTVIYKSSPVSVVGNHSFTSLASGFNLNLGVKLNGEIWSWGRNFFGQLGQNNTIDRSSPVLVIGTP